MGILLTTQRTLLSYSIYSEFIIIIVLQEKRKKTPAMRLGLAKGIVSPEDIIYFSPN